MNPLKICILILTALAFFWTDCASATLTMPLVTVADAGNAVETSSGLGSVGYNYRIGTYEVTAGEYTQFLNAVAQSDPNQLYNSGMASGYDGWGCHIARSGSDGSYAYTVDTDWVNRPVNYVSFEDATRFVNWLENGQPVGLQNAQTTETGSYNLIGLTTEAQLVSFVRTPQAHWVIPTENEWFKAAYYKGGSLNAGYWLYPTQTDATPVNTLSSSSNAGNFYASGIPDQVHGTTVVGSYTNSTSPYGTYDQGGNIWELTETEVYNMVYSRYARRLRGGAYVDSVDKLANTSNLSSSFYTDENWAVGFRVAFVPEPAVAALLLTATFLFIAARNNRRSDLPADRKGIAIS